MPDTAAFMPEGQSAYAFPQAGEQDEAAATEQQNRQIQAAFDAQRFQHTQSQSVSKAMAYQQAQIAHLRQQQAQKGS
jgi:hypothetical protein